jgi:radical SAM superfamily enzyme YgiQ (UPF0313 family)
MKVFFVNPPLKNLHFSRSQRSPGVIKSGTMYYPYWLAHAAALVDANGYEIHLMDCPADGCGREDLLERVIEFSPDVVVIDTSTPSVNYDMETLQYLKNKVHACYVLVGTHVTSEYQDCLNKCPETDFIVIGEYDFTILDLVRSFENNSNVKDVAGIAYLEKGSVVLTSGRSPIEDMDELPWIAPIYQKFLTPKNYLFTLARQPMLMLIGGRGCKAKCFYCVYPQVMHGHSYRTRSIKHLVGEMKWIEKNMPEIKEIVFEDDTFTSDKKRAVEFAELVKSEGIRLPWFANIRTNTSYETLAALKDAGLRECAVGFESGDDLILSNMRKGQTVEAQRRFMSYSKRLDLLVHGCFMVGFPGETPETLMKTLRLALELSPDSAQFYPVMPYPGTGAYKWAENNQFLTTDNFDEWLDEKGGHRCVLDLPDLSAKEIGDFCEYAFKKYHFRPKYILRKLGQAFVNPKEGVRSFNAGINFIYSLFVKKEKNFRSISNVNYDENWRNKVKVPYGRMEELEKNIGSSITKD